MPEQRIIARKVLSRGSGLWIQCAMMQCEKDGYDLYKTILHDHVRGLHCDHPRAQHVNFIFCSERCKQYFLHSHRDMWQLPPGYKTVL